MKTVSQWGSPAPGRRRRILRGMVGLASMGVLCQMMPAANPQVSRSPGQGLGAVGDFPGDVTAGFAALLGGGTAASPAPEYVANPRLGALSARGLPGLSLAKYLKIPGMVDSLTIPEAFSVVMWVRVDPKQKSTVLFGFGEPGGDYLVGATDSFGAPSLAFLNPKKVSQVDRSTTAPVDLADGQMHAVVAVVNLGSGLARLYVDGRPEAATTISFWRPQRLEQAFASYSLLGRTSVPGIEAEGLMMPRIVRRELSEDEIRKIKPAEGDPDLAGIDEALGLKLARDTLVEFWPAQYSYLLRERPMSGR